METRIALTRIACTVYCTPTPQGSKRGFVVPGKFGKKPRAVITEDNKKTKPYRQAITQTVMQELISTPWCGKESAVWLTLNFYLAKPPSVSKKRFCPTVKPDVDKLVRATLDALTGVLFVDDAQVVELNASKNYGTPERVEIVCRTMAKESLPAPHEPELLCAQ